MANVTLSRKEFEKHFKLDEKTLEAINLFGTSASLSPENLEIEIFPNRPDLLSLQGFVRAMKAYFGKSPGLPTYSVKSPNQKLIVEKSTPIEWSYALAFLVHGLTLNNEKIKELIDIQEKLGTTLLRKRKKGGIGLYPLEKIQFPITFKGMKPEEIKFRPLEFPNAITGRQILSMHPTGREYADICASWEKFPVFTDKTGAIMSMPPIINSHELGKITETTKDIFVEATGTDLQILKHAVAILATTLADMGGKITAIECVQSNGERIISPSLSPQTHKVSLEKMNALLGTQIKEKEAQNLLARMGHTYEKGKVKSPAWRIDLLHEVDIAEDLAIAYGYQSLIPELPAIATIASSDPEDEARSKIADLLVGLNLTEISTYHLIKESELSKDEEKIEVENSKTEYKCLRTSLIQPMLRTFTDNKGNEYPQKMFEIGTVFARDSKKESGISETQTLCIACSPANVTEMKQILNYLCSALGLTASLKETQKKGFIEGRTGAIHIQGKDIGFIGELHPETLRDWNLKMPLTLLEINLDSLLKEKLIS